jgi:hypothetical protein
METAHSKTFRRITYLLCGIAAWSTALPMDRILAQSQPGPLREAPDLPTPDANFTAAGAAQVYRAAEPSLTSGVMLPSNLTVSGPFRALVEAMLRSSPTFRRQCLRIGSAADLHVTIRSGLHNPNGPRARTRLTVAPGGHRRAIVEVLVPRDHAELIAHELEHIIEQLDGIDLAGRALRHSTGVRRLLDGPFETTRAVRAGEAVAEEMRLRTESR